MHCRSIARGLMLLGVWVCLGLGGGASALEAVQTDWCQGDGEPGPVATWGDRFDTCRDVSWRPLPGQLALASDPLAAPVQHIIATGLPVAFGIHPVDIDQDGDVDVIGGAGLAQVVALWYNDGQSPPGWTQQLVDATYPGATGVHAADIDGDGDLDIVAAAETPGNKVAWWRNDGGTPIAWTRQLLDNYCPVSCSITTADINHDGRPDVLATSWSLGDVIWWRNEGGDPVTWTRFTIDANFGGAHDAYAADLDGDGDLDVVGAAGIHNRVAWWRNQGGDPIVWERQIIASNFNGARAVHVADINRDGRLDVVATAFANHVTWWRNDGGDPLAWTRQDIDDAFNGGHSVWTGDVDGDGRTDVMATAYYDSTVAWWCNTGGDPIVWEEHDLTTSWINALNIRAGDVDGDGDLDILATSRELGEFAWWEASQFKSGGELTSSVLDLQGQPQSADLEWTARVPEGAGLDVCIRSGADPADLGPWSAPMTSPGPLSGPLERYLQYKIELETGDPARSPVLEEVRVTYEPSMDVPGDRRSADGGFGLNVVSPARDAADIRLSVPEPSRVRLDLYDIGGRRVAALADQELPAGEHRVRVHGLATGVYLCCLSCGQVRLTDQITVNRAVPPGGVPIAHVEGPSASGGVGRPSACRGPNRTLQIAAQVADP
jgi:hypothetical protein